MVSALGYSCLVHITRVDHQGINNRHVINFIVKICSDAHSKLVIKSQTFNTISLAKNVETFLN